MTDSVFIVVNKAGRVVFHSANLKQLFGYESIQGRKMEILLPEDKWAAHMKHFDRFMIDPTRRTMGGAAMKLEGRHEDGSVFPVFVGLGPFEFNGVMFACAMIKRAD